MKQYSRRILAVLAIILVVFGGCAKVGATSYTAVDGKEALKMMEESTNYIIVDVRTPEEYAEEHIAHAINIPNETIGKNEIVALPDKQQQIFVYCRSGNRSKQASEKLAQQGYSNIIEFGGIKDWDGPTVVSQKK